MKAEFSPLLTIAKMVLLVGLFPMASCTSARQRALDEEARLAAMTPVDPETVYSYWDDQVGPEAGPVRVRIDLGEQTAYIYRGETQIGKSRVATGTRGRNTPTGNFRIMEKIVEKRSNLYGQIVDAAGNVVNWNADSRRDRAPAGGMFLGAEMPYWMRLTSRGIGMHVGPIPVPGNTASHGCIRMRQEIAVKLFENSVIGTPVVITQ